MVPTTPTPLYSGEPTFFQFLQDALLALGVPYGPQARVHLARAHPALFGHSQSTLRGYERWLARTASSDTREAFASYMDERYKRWVGAAA